MPTFNQRIERDRAFEALRSGNMREAYRLGTALLGRARNDVALWGLVGVAASKIGHSVDAERYLVRALKRAPNDHALLIAYAETLLREGRIDESIERYRCALGTTPGDPYATTGLASAYEHRGELDKARDLLRPLLEDGQEDAYAALVMATVLQSSGEHARSLDLIEKHLARPQTDLAMRRSLCELAAKAYEKTGEHDRAFRCFELSNRLIECPFDPDEFTGAIDMLISVFSPANLRTIPRSSGVDPLPMFIASMPRSGSTLCEQIIHAHPQAHGAGEITDLMELVEALPARLDSIQAYPQCLGDLTTAHADRAGRWYLDRIRSLDRRAKRIVNKHLENWRHLGLVALLMPGARVVHCRRDPMDNCFSIFMAAMNPRAHPWSTNLTSIAHAYRQYRRLMDHWRHVLDIEILDVCYEELVAAPEQNIRRLIEFTGLEWDERCLAFHEARRDVTTLSYDQVRRPMYRSAVARWKKYEAHLEPLRAALGDVASEA